MYCEFSIYTYFYRTEHLKSKDAISIHIEELSEKAAEIKLLQKKLKLSEEKRHEAECMIIRLQSDLQKSKRFVYIHLIHRYCSRYFLF